MAKLIKVDPKLLRMALRTREVPLEGVLVGVILTVRPPTGHEKLRWMDYMDDGNFAKASLHLAVSCIVDWNIAGEDGEKLEITEAALSQMSADAYNEIMQVTQPLIQDMTPGEERFLPESSDTSVRGEQPPSELESSQN